MNILTYKLLDMETYYKLLTSVSSCSHLIFYGKALFLMEGSVWTL